MKYGSNKKIYKKIKLMPLRPNSFKLVCKLNQNFIVDFPKIAMAQFLTN